MNLRFTLKQCLVALFFAQASFCSNKFTPTLSTISEIDHAQIACNTDLFKILQEIEQIKKECNQVSNNLDSMTSRTKHVEFNNSLVEKKIQNSNQILSTIENHLTAYPVVIDQKTRAERAIRRNQQSARFDLGLSTAKSFWKDITNEQTQREEQQAQLKAAQAIALKNYQQKQAAQENICSKKPNHKRNKK